MTASIKDAGLCALFAAVGLTVNLTWCTLAGHTPGFNGTLSSIGVAVNPRAFFLAGILVIGIAFVALPRKMREWDASLWPAVALLASVGTGCFAIAANQDAFPPIMLAIGGLIVFGVGYFWLTARFMLLLARTQSFACTAACVSASLIAEPVLVAAMERLGSATQIGAVIALPIISAALFQCARSAALKQRAREASGGRTVFGVPSLPNEGARVSDPAEMRNAFILAAASSLLLATVRGLSFVGLWGEGHFDTFEQPSMTSHPGLWAVYAIALIGFAYLVLYRTASWPLRLRFQPSFLTIILTLAASMILAGDAHADPALLDTLMRLNDSFSHLMFWMLVVIIANAVSIPSYRVIGAAGSLYAGASIVWVLFLGKASAVENLIVIMVIYLLTIVSMHYGWDKRGTERIEQHDAHDAAAGANVASDTETTEQSEEGLGALLMTRAIERRCAEVAQTYRLSPRESEILVLLAQGRTRTYIQEELVLAENTVKTHVTHIYGKLGVRDRQDMIDIVLGLADEKNEGGR